MGKRTSKGGARKGGHDGSDFDDSSSVMSASTTCSAYLDSGDMHVIQDNPFNDLVDKLFEKRAATRDKAFAGLIELLRTSVREEDCLKSEMTVVGRCVNGLKKGSSRETAAAATLAGVLVLTIGPDADRSFHEELLPELERVCRHDKNSSARVAAVHALSVCSYVTSSDDAGTLEVMETLSSLWGTADAQVLAAALRGWAFLLTVLRRVPEYFADKHLEELAEMLHSADVEVRACAGETIAMLCHLTPSGVAGSSDDDDVEVSEESSMTDELSGLEDVMDHMRDLAKNRFEAQRKSRKHRAALRSSFRRLCNVMEDGSVPAQKIKLQHGDLLVVDSLVGVTTINYFRRFLAGGFQTHLQHNTLLHDILEFSPLTERPEKLSAQERRAYRSPSSVQSKARAQGRKYARGCKEARMGALCE